MTDASKLSLDMFLTILRYCVIAWCFKNGVTDNAVMTAYANLVVAGGTALWGLYASGYWHRAVDWFKNLSKV